MQDTTIQALQKLRHETRLPLRALEERLRLPSGFHATLSDILNRRHAKVSPYRENVVRNRLGLVPIDYESPRECPSCGARHVIGECRVQRRETKKKKQTASSLRRKKLRSECRKMGLTLEDAAEYWLKSQIPIDNATNKGIG